MATTVAATQYVNVHALVQIGWVGLLTGAGLVAIYALGIVGVGRYRQAQQSGAGAVPYLALAVLCFLVVVASIAFGVNLMLDK